MTNLGLPSVSVPVLSTTNVRRLQHFDGFSVFEQHADLRSLADCYHDGHRCRQTQGTWASDYQDGNGIDNAYAMLGSGPMVAHTMNVMMATTITAGTKYARHSVRQF